MKGLSSSLLAMVLFIVVIIGGATIFGISWSWEKGINRQISFQRDVPTLSNALEAAKQYLDISLHYSVYQSLFDTGREGMGIEIWYKNKDVSPTKEEFEKILSEKIENIMEKYTKSGFVFINTNYIVSLPNPVNIKSDLQGTNLIVRTDPENLKIEKNETEYIRFERNASTSFSIEYRLFTLGKDFVKKNNLTNIIFNSLGTWKTQGQKELAGCDNKDIEITDLDVFNEINSKNFSSWFEAKDKIVDNIKTEIDVFQTKINENLKNITYNITILEKTVDIETECSETKQEKCTDTGTFSFVKNCTFRYVFETNLTVEIVDKNNYYPVSFEEEINFKPMELIFAEQIRATNPVEIEA